MDRDSVLLIVSAIVFVGSFLALRGGYGILALIVILLYLVWFWQVRRRSR